MPARPAESPRHERVFIGFGGPRGHGDSFEDAVQIRPGVDAIVDATRMSSSQEVEVFYPTRWR
jgi:hypothetical protein